MTSTHSDRSSGLLSISTSSLRIWVTTPAVRAPGPNVRSENAFWRTMWRTRSISASDGIGVLPVETLRPPRRPAVDDEECDRDHRRRRADAQRVVDPLGLDAVDRVARTPEPAVSVVAALVEPDAPHDPV